ncbi:hypothetical protein GF325_02755 [Candidatus Bathyarchaeota archaeon]|nr:hypothetical protein [Candidatus Bathyarchaeota archaeon]
MVPKTVSSDRWISKHKEKKKAQQALAREYWKQVGFHRPLGGFWFNYVLLLILALPGIIVIGIVLPAILPYPSALGFNNTITSLLMPIYLFADFGIKGAIERFISQYSEIDPHRAMKYAAFFLWYQMITGALQVTLISIMAVTIIPKTNLSYSVWFFLAFIMIQWPGTAGLFQTLLNGFQQFNKSNIIYVLQNVAIQTATQVIFIIIGMRIGYKNPKIGPLMGSTMGFIIGSYVDDLIALVVGMLLFKKVLKPLGIKLVTVMHLSFDRSLAKQVLIYGGKMMPSGLVYVGVNAIITIMVTNWLPSYSDLVGLYQLASGLIGALGVSFTMGPPMTESYTNGKEELSIYLINAQFKWWGLISIGVLMAPLLFLIPDIIVTFASEYSGIQEMVFPLFLGAFILFPSMFCGTITQACDLPAQHSYLNFIEQGTRIVTYFIALSPWTFKVWFGDAAVYWFWLFAEAPGYAAKAIYGWWMIKRKLFPDKKIGFPAYQALIAPALSMSPFILLSWIMKRGFFRLYQLCEINHFGLGAGWEFVPAYLLAALYLVLLLFIYPIFIIFPLYGFLGAWDEQSLEDFRKAALMAGPSKGLVMTLYKGTNWGYMHSPFKNRFSIPHETAMKQASEITALRRRISDG